MVFPLVLTSKKGRWQGAVPPPPALHFYRLLSLHSVRRLDCLWRLCSRVSLDLMDTGRPHGHQERVDDSQASSLYTCCLGDQQHEDLEYQHDQRRE